MKTSKNPSNDCQIEATFIGGTFDGEKMWFDDTPDKLLRTKFQGPDENGVMIYKGDSIYKLVSANPARYQVVNI